MTAPARYKDLCIDAIDAHAAARFWAPLTGLQPHLHDDGFACLRDDDGDVLVWINPVPEPVTVKNRVHLDINAESPQTALDAGATFVDDTHGWVVLRDPDGQELCVFSRPEPITQRLYELVWDTAEGADASHRIAGWWAELLGGHLVDDERGFSYVDRLPGCPFDSFDFVGVPEPKTTKNRVHIDVTTDDVRLLLDRGAQLLRAKGDDGLPWNVLADPDGNEFCAFTPD